MLRGAGASAYTAAAPYLNLYGILHINLTRFLYMLHNGQFPDFVLYYNYKEEQRGNLLHEIVGSETSTKEVFA